MSAYIDADVRAVMESLGCQRDLDEETGAAYCTEHNCGWLSDIDACARPERMLEEVAPAIVRRAKAEALREFAALTRGPSKDLRDVGTCLSIALDAEVMADMAEAGIEAAP